MDEWLDRYPTKYQRHFYNPVLLDFCSEFNLNDTQMYTWFKPDGSIKSRIDLCLVSDIRSGLESTATISAAPLTDHCIIKLNSIPSNTRFKKGSWKFYSNLLKN